MSARMNYIASVLVLCIGFITDTCNVNALNTMMSRTYHHMGYNATGSSLAQLIITKELLCAAQCANHFPTCNIAVFNGSSIYQCTLFSELLVAGKLIIYSNAVVYDFQLSKFQATTTTTTTVSTPQFTKITGPNDTIVGIFNTLAGSSNNANVGNWTSNESPSSAFDNNVNTKYLNFAAGDTSSIGGLGSGLYVTPRVGRSVATGIQFATANDNYERDPITVTLEGSNNASAQLHFGASWTLIYSGPTGINASVNPGRTTYVPMQNFSNTTAFTSYRVLVTSKRASSYGVQYSEFSIYGFI